MSIDEPYGKLLSTYFTGTTGMRLQELGAPGKDALLLGLFLTANEWANMIGLYEISLSKLSRKFPCIKGKALDRSFDLLAAESFAHFDPDTEVIWVREMARVRLGLSDGPIPNPRKLVAAQNCYQRAPLNPFLGPFFDRYHVQLVLPHRRGGPPGSPGLPNVRQSSDERSANVQQSFTERSANVPMYQRAGTSKQVPESNEQIAIAEKAAAAPRLVRPVENPDDNIEVITTLVTKELLSLGLHESDLTEATKSACARKGIAYNSSVVRKAVESAIYRSRMPRVVAR